jgi:hypothetical protein
VACSSASGLLSILWGAPSLDPPKHTRRRSHICGRASASNVGADKDSEEHQRQAIAGFAKHNGFELVGEHYDADVSGADPQGATGEDRR